VEAKTRGTYFEENALLPSLMASTLDYSVVGREGGKEGRREGRREGEREGGKEGRREGRRERGREGGRKGGKEGGREGLIDEGFFSLLSLGRSTGPLSSRLIRRAPPCPAQVPSSLPPSLPPCHV
jgi:hypothetical protein